jgi:hypothetical protein
MTVLNVVVSLTLISFLFAAIYKVLPDRDLEWGDVVVGAIVAQWTNPPSDISNRSCRCSFALTAPPPPLAVPRGFAPRSQQQRPSRSRASPASQQRPPRCPRRDRRRRRGIADHDELPRIAKHGRPQGRGSRHREAADDHPRRARLTLRRFNRDIKPKQTVRQDFDNV